MTFGGCQYAHHYVPNILIYSTSRVIGEIKPTCFIEKDAKMQAKIKAGRRWAEKNGYDFVVVTEFELFDK